MSGPLTWRIASALLVLGVVTVSPVVAQVNPLVTSPNSDEAVKKSALWTDCATVGLGVSLYGDSDLSLESVWNAAEVALRSTGIYFQENPDSHIRPIWRVVVSIALVGSAAHIETGFVKTYTGLGDDRQLVGHTVMLYRVTAVAANAADASLLATVREQMDAFLVDYLRANDDCAAEGPPVGPTRGLQTVHHRNTAKPKG